jgi:hypothetical protein
LNWSADFQIGMVQNASGLAESEFGAPLAANAVQTILVGARTISVHGRQKKIFIKGRGGSKTVTMIPYCERR